MELPVYTTSGTDSGLKASFEDQVFKIEPNDHAIYLDVRLYRDNQRRGTHSVKGRGEVRGSTKKPFRQKGTGNARQGHKRSPLMRHGGTVFGPKPHDYGFKLNRKVKILARKSALTHKANENAITVVKNPAFNVPKTKEFITLLKNLKCENKKLLVITSGQDKTLYLSGRNMTNVTFTRAEQLNTYDVVNVEHVLFIDDSVAIINDILTRN